MVVRDGDQRSFHPWSRRVTPSVSQPSPDVTSTDRGGSVLPTEKTEGLRRSTVSTVPPMAGSFGTFSLEGVPPRYRTGVSAFRTDSPQSRDPGRGILPYPRHSPTLTSHTVLAKRLERGVVGGDVVTPVTVGHGPLDVLGSRRRTRDGRCVGEGGRATGRPTLGTTNGSLVATPDPPYPLPPVRTYGRPTV